MTSDIPAWRDSQSAGAWFSYKAKVTRVIDGDTLVARIGRRSNRVRLIGIDTPELGACYAVQTTAMARALASNRRVTLQGDRTQSLRDRFGRLLAYARLPIRRDRARQLLRAGRGRLL